MAAMLSLVVQELRERQRGRGAFIKVCARTTSHIPRPRWSAVRLMLNATPPHLRSLRGLELASIEDWGFAARDGTGGAGEAPDTSSGNTVSTTRSIIHSRLPAFERLTWAFYVALSTGFRVFRLRGTNRGVRG